MSLSIRRIDQAPPPVLDALCALLFDAVDSGASIGFLASLSADSARRYWQLVLSSVADGSQCLWIAEVDGKIVGTVQLALCEKENGRHRAEVQKLLVLQSHRGQGISSRLMETIDAYARDAGRSLLVLDTLVGTTAENVYRHLGWQRAGEIPRYAGTPDGALHATVYYYKFIAI